MMSRWKINERKLSINMCNINNNNTLNCNTNRINILSNNNTLRKGGVGILKAEDSNKEQDTIPSHMKRPSHML